MFRYLLAIALVAAPLAANAQCIGGSTTTMAAVTVATGNTFQSILASNPARKGCVVQYTGTTVGYVFFGTNGSATKATSIQLPPYGTINCNSNGGLILTDNISVTSATTSDTFVIASQ